MYRRFHPGAGPARRRLLAGAALAAALTGGCTQATRHANMMIFGTNTVVGLSAGKDVDTPAITVGYKRQELVLMPLVANEKENGSRELVPCDMTLVSRTTDWSDPNKPKQVEQKNGKDVRADHPCLLVATHVEKDKLVRRDSYSVLASFGADFDSGATTGEVKARSGLAQYFATGMAAQMLASTGGAAVVSAGPAAEEAAKKLTPATSLAVAQGDPEVVEASKQLIEGAPSATKALQDWISLLPDDPVKRAEEIKTATADLGFDPLPAVLCNDLLTATDKAGSDAGKAKCRAAMESGALVLMPTVARQKKLATGLTARGTALKGRE